MTTTPPPAGDDVSAVRVMARAAYQSARGYGAQRAMLLLYAHDATEALFGRGALAGKGFDRDVALTSTWLAEILAAYRDVEHDPAVVWITRPTFVGVPHDDRPAVVARVMGVPHEADVCLTLLAEAIDCGDLLTVSAVTRAAGVRR